MEHRHPPQAIGEHTAVTLHFSLRLANGDVVDSTFDKAPARFEFGDGQLPEGFQSYLPGLCAGQRKMFEVPPEKAFGMRNPNNVQCFKRTDFPADMALAQGLVISFADAGKTELPGVVASFDSERVTVDFNHPLAGQTLVFEVEIIDVEAL
jgi:FKBP-type peptidyl-prolyl cis-trans isomerase SlpA